MNPLLTPKRTLRQMARWPLIRMAAVRFRRAQFFSSSGTFAYYGLFESFEEARAWLPKTPEFNSELLVTEYVEVRSKRVFEYDYPVMWRLEHALRHGAKGILDIGGSVGVHYYAYLPYIQQLERQHWQVVEVPAIAAVGRKLAKQNAAKGLCFLEDLDQAVRSAKQDIWLSAGAIQYVEDGRPDLLLRRAGTRPRHVLLNKLPLYDGPDFVTTQNIGDGSYSPLHVYNRQRFVERIQSLGYRLKDEWAVNERSLHLPGHPERCVPTFSGFYFEADGPSADFGRREVDQPRYALA